jgi:hypothetical protein
LAAVFVAGLLAARPSHAEPDRYGVMADIGLPDGIVGSFSYRALDWVSAHIGVGHNTNSFGLRAGARLDPLDRVIAPYLSVDAGVYGDADTASWMRSTAQSAGLDDKTLERLGYWYANGHLGVRFGSGSAWIYLQGGVSYIDIDATVIKPKPNFVPPVDLYRETVVHVWTASGRGGFLYRF